MISYIKGKILEKGNSYIILENGGIGYKVFVTPEALDSKIGDIVDFYIYHKVSEDGQSLFGLPNFSTLQFFELLITVSGVGPKVALAILSAAHADSIKQAIANQDSAIFTRISGVGLKTAEKIILELKNKVVSDRLQSVNSDVFEALVALGYNQREIREVLKKVDVNLPSNQQLKEVLKLLGKS